MTSYNSDDASAESLKQLMTLVPDPGRAERVRVRCRAQLARSQRRMARTALIAGLAWRVLAPVVVGGFCVLYVTALLTTTVRLERLFH